LKKNLSKKSQEAKKLEMDLEELKDLIRMLHEHNVYDFEYSKGDYHVRIKHGSVIDSVEPSSASSGTGTSSSPEKTPPEAPPAPQDVQAAPASAEKLLEVRSPMVGTFFRSSTPGASAFVEVGDMVRKNQVLCIVEAMKIMNEIESDVEGELVGVHVSNGQPVEFGEMLFSIRPIS
jgi:acetyl-CoA carboxylase biotin carboxyl carrier protein